jgi:hypothetical protein
MPASSDKALIVKVYPSLIASSPRTHSASSSSAPSGVVRRRRRVACV